MFEALSSRLSDTLRKLTGKGVLSEDDVREGLREIRRCLLEADVSFDLTRQFLERVQEKATGQEVLKAVKPGQQLVKIVYDELVALLGEKQAPLAFASVPPTIILVVGLQGSGKTTTAGKLARRLKNEQKAPFLIAADVYRPAAIDQLVTLGDQVGVGVFSVRPSDGQTVRPDVVSLVKAGVEAANKARARTVIVDTAGRLQIDDEMMGELARIKAAVKPHEILLVADGMTGQDAVRIAQGFHEALGITGVILTKMDGDSRGGAALSIYGVTHAPIKYVGVGEKLDALEPFHPERLAGRILQQGDVLTLVEKAQDKIDLEKALDLEKKLRKDNLTLEDFLTQMREMRKLGSLGDILRLLPGAHKIDAKMTEQGERDMKRVEAIILSMTVEERRKPQLLDASRKRRIAKGSGMEVQNVNKLLRDFEQVRTLAKRMKGPKKGLPVAPANMRGRGGFRFGG